MLHDTTRKFLGRSGFNEMQADALADMMSELSSKFATKDDLDLLQARLENQMNALKADLTWRFVALTVFLGTVLSLVNIFAA